tara:strand:- start:258 stop:509 length:252 start_codon:yes stop_codon:yes gene_type:complete
MEVQSVRLEKSKYSTLALAEQKIKSLGFSPKYRGKNMTQYKAGESIKFWRARQQPPSRFIEDSFRTKKLSDGITLIVGKLIKK